MTANTDTKECKKWVGKEGKKLAQVGGSAPISIPRGTNEFIGKVEEKMVLFA